MTSTTPRPEAEARRRRTVIWIVALATFGLVFDGYDLVLYGAVVSTFLRDPTHIGNVTPAIAGLLGSYALVGVMVGALLAGAVGDIIGRRKVMLMSYAWFSVGMALTAMATTSIAFGWLRFSTGLGIGALLATTAALVSEYAPADKKNLINAITNGGIPLGSLLAALLAILLMQHIGWRGLFWMGALPIVTLLPLAYAKMPESVVWLASRGHMDEARAVSERTGVPLPGTVSVRTEAIAPAGTGKIGFAGLFSTHYLLPTAVLGLMSATGLMLVYSLNTWLPEIMLRAGFNAKGSLSFLAVLNGGSLFGALAASRAADRFGPKPVVAACFTTGAMALLLLTLGFPLAGLLVIVAVVGLGTSGTQTLIYGFVANYYRTNVRAAGVAWCAGFGRLGGIGGPMLGSTLIGAGFKLDAIFYVLAGLGLVGALLTLLVPMARAQTARRPGQVEENQGPATPLQRPA
ncbi:MFS transporter [Sphaerotilus sp.]|uniref:MFS transporter n=1 Tax=Sphaerotilus sp. TaxID=2093942 RepID=UPI0034E19BF2